MTSERKWKKSKDVTREELDEMVRLKREGWSNIKISEKLGYLSEQIRYILKNKMPDYDEYKLMRRAITPEVITEIIALKREYKINSDIGKEVGRSTFIVGKILKEYMPDYDEYKSKRKKNLSEEDLQLAMAMKREHKNNTKIGQKLGYSSSHISRILKKEMTDYDDYTLNISDKKKRLSLYEKKIEDAKKELGDSVDSSNACIVLECKPSIDLFDKIIKEREQDTDLKMIDFTKIISEKRDEIVVSIRKIQTELHKNFSRRKPNIVIALATMIRIEYIKIGETSKFFGISEQTIRDLNKYFEYPIDTKNRSGILGNRMSKYNDIIRNFDMEIEKRKYDEERFELINKERLEIIGDFDMEIEKQKYGIDDERLEIMIFYKKQGRLLTWIGNKFKIPKKIVTIYLILNMPNYFQFNINLNPDIIDEIVVNLDSEIINEIVELKKQGNTDNYIGKRLGFYSVVVRCIVKTHMENSLIELQIQEMIEMKREFKTNKEIALKFNTKQYIISEILRREMIDYEEYKIRKNKKVIMPEVITEMIALKREYKINSDIGKEVGHSSCMVGKILKEHMPDYDEFVKIIRGRLNTAKLLYKNTSKSINKNTPLFYD